METDTRGQMLDVLFNELNESEQLEEGVVGTAVGNAFKKVGNNIRAGVQQGLNNMKPAFTAQQKAQKAARSQQIEDNRVANNGQLDANLQAEKDGKAAGKAAMQNIGQAKKTASDQYKKYSQEYAKPNAVMGALGNMMKADLSAKDDLKSMLEPIVQGCCALLASAQVYITGSNDTLAGAAADNKQAKKDQNISKKDAKAMGKAVAQQGRDNAQKQADADAAAGVGLPESLTWSASQLFHIKESDSGKFAKQAMTNLLTQYNILLAAPNEQSIGNFANTLTSVIGQMANIKDSLASAQSKEGRQIFNPDAIGKAFEALNKFNNKDAIVKAVTETANKMQQKAGNAEGGDNTVEGQAQASQKTKEDIANSVPALKDNPALAATLAKMDSKALMQLQTAIGNMAKVSTAPAAAAPQ